MASDVEGLIAHEITGLVARGCCFKTGGTVRPSDTKYAELRDDACECRAVARDILRALSAAGLAIYDTRTHAAVPREPTEAMAAAALAALRQATTGKKGTQSVWSAMVAAAESPEDKPDE